MSKKETKIVRLTTGEELLAKLEDTDNSFILTDPAILIPAGEGKLAFAPWCPYSNAKDGVEIGKEHIMFVSDPAEELEKQYMSALSGLIIPSKGDVSSMASDVGFRGAGDPALKLTT